MKALKNKQGANYLEAQQVKQAKKQAKQSRKLKRNKRQLWSV